MKLLVTMGIPKPEVNAKNTGDFFIGARMEILDVERKECVKAIEYTAPSENLGEGCNLKFTGGTPYKEKWYQATATEIIVYNPQDWSVERVFSHPSFHDLHGLCVADDEIAIVNTGLEIIQFMNMDGEIMREVNIASVPTWERFDRNTDYRCVKSTKPHEIHPNHVFKIDGQWWTTRMHTQDAINLDNPEDRIDIEVGQPHDGVIRGDFIYFTTTNAHVVVANISTRKVEDVIDLNHFSPVEGGRIGWCRGIEVEGDVAYVSFSCLRRTKWVEVYHWAKDMYFGRKRNSHIEMVNIARKELIDSYDYQEYGKSALFTVMNYDRVLGKLPSH